jgi:CxxC-x17-CxxC domain-containing protein
MFKKPYKSKPHFEKKLYDNAMHTATCSGCGKDCQVPFKPNGKKPVFCSACYVREEKGGGDDYRKESRGEKSSFYEKKSGYQSRSHDRPESRPSLNGITTEQFKTLNAKLDAILKMIRGDDEVV